MPLCWCVGDLLGGRGDEAHVGVFGLVERRGHADDDRVGLAEDRGIGRGASSSPFFDERARALSMAMSPMYDSPALSRRTLTGSLS